MGLHVHNLGNLPADSEREYFIYMLDYGWHESLSEAMRANFTNMARLASKSKSVVIAGVEPIHFENEVFSYHGINGEHGEDILPALMVTTLHPRYFKEHNHSWRESGEIEDKLLLIPLKSVVRLQAMSCLLFIKYSRISRVKKSYQALLCIKN
ncbi:hypothetical protein [Vibrio cidicii]|uniref:hypothetical protein n=1 Tax=Vibrio cidicii TaxID=1763883 RepID=UPI001E4E25D4|nr:hypothetical protein [Vibrio cidicii]